MQFHLFAMICYDICHKLRQEQYGQEHTKLKKRRKQHNIIVSNEEAAQRQGQTRT